MTSHDVVDFVRRLVPRRTRVGHAGTLDPGAAGVLVICLGSATRLAEYIMAGEKSYRAEITLGVETDTLDADGATVVERNASSVAEPAVRSAVSGLVGARMMAPPMYSAARVDGERLYELARRGESVERRERPVAVHSADLVRFAAGTRATALVDIRCSKGTYIRVLAADLGDRLGVGGHLSFLVRTAVGPHAIAESHTLEETAAAHQGAGITSLCISPSEALAHLPEARVDGRGCRDFTRGRALRWGGAAPGLFRVLDADGRLIGIGEAVSERGEWRLRPHKVLATP
jgi:tRNA pseudouridine55 synthase